MRIKKLIIAITCGPIVWAALALANEAPPNLPFQALDGTSLTPYQDDDDEEEETGDRGMGNQAPNPQAGINGQMVGGGPSIPVQNPQQMNPPTDEPVPSEPVVAQKPAAKPKKRPPVLDKAPEPKKLRPQVQEQASEPGPQHGLRLKPKPGVTERVVVARGKLNRIVTPYTNPKVLTVDKVETKIDGAVIYIATDSDADVNLFVSDETGNAISLQLLPRDIGMPVEIIIEQDAARASGPEAASSRTDGLTRQDSPYVAEIKAIMQGMGKQQIPQGFTLEEMTGEVRSLSVCHGTNLSFTAGQLLSGHDSRLIVMVAQNQGGATTVFEEAYCATEDVMAVAAWPKVRLGPGEKTEVYLLMRLPKGTNGEEIRPALLD